MSEVTDCFATLAETVSKIPLKFVLQQARGKLFKKGGGGKERILTVAGAMSE
ncbi:MAG: hypothetical protein ABR958_02340 [Dehalococcoidales bacterium]